MGHQRTTAPVPQASNSTKKLAGSAFPSQQPLLCQEKTNSLPRGGKQSWQQEAEGCSAVEKEHAQPRQGAFPGHSDLLPGPSQDCSGIHTNQGGGGSQVHSRPPPFQSNPVSSQAALMALHRPGSPPPPNPHQRFRLHIPDVTKGQVLAESLLSYPPPQIHPNPLKKGVGQATTCRAVTATFLPATRKPVLTLGPSTAGPSITSTSPSHLRKQRLQKASKQAAQSHRGNRQPSQVKKKLGPSDA